MRHDLQRLSDAGVLEAPLTTWPLSWGDIDRSLANAESGEVPASAMSAYLRVTERLRRETADEAHIRIAASAAGNPRVIRTFENTPREDGEFSAGLSWLGERFALNLSASAVIDPFDEDEVRPDGTYIGVALGNWMLSAGWQERWWGPGRDGSLILSSNARPSPGVAVQRNNSTPFQSKWLRWIGPWTFTAFMNQLDDERVIDDALLFGIRFTFMPIDSLEIGLSRTAQWCGDNRPCDFDTFTDLLIGNDNRGVNVDPDEEPGNQLAGVDMRWRLPHGIPLAFYAQWIGEDTRRGGPEIGSWLRQAGIEHWGTAKSAIYRAHLEVAETSCRQGGFGFSESVPNCAYNHGIYRTGYRFNGRPIGHSTDNDGLSASFGLSLLEEAGNSWNLSLRFLQINRIGQADDRHTLSRTARDIADVQISHERLISVGKLHIGLGYSQQDDDTANSNRSSDVNGFIRWSSR